MFCVIEIVGRSCNKVTANLKYDDALELAIKICMEQDDASEDSIRRELIADYDCQINDEHTVYISSQE
jgi:hypothetical protein